MVSSVTVNVAFDSEAGVWCIVFSDLRGLHIESDTLEEMQAALPGAVLDLLELDARGNAGPQDVPVELIAHTRTLVRVGV